MQASPFAGTDVHASTGWREGGRGEGGVSKGEESKRETASDSVRTCVRETPASPSPKLSEAATLAAD
jgi:hypothetical protein